MYSDFQPVFKFLKMPCKCIITLRFTLKIMQIKRATCIQIANFTHIKKLKIKCPKTGFLGGTYIFGKHLFGALFPKKLI